MEKIKVGVVGYGTIGKRVADAVLLQEDMELVGVTGNSYNYRIEVANSRGINIYVLGNDEEFKNNNISVAGNFDDLLSKVDIVVDCSPKPYGKENKEKYIKASVKGIYQGGEKADVGEVSFVAQSNYKECIGKDHIRVVSCNTTGMTRTLDALHKAYGVIRARATMIRRAADPADTKKGPLNSIIPALEMPSHHGPDVRTVIPDIEVFTTAVVVPTTLMHMHNLSVRLKKVPSTEEVVELFKKTTRVRIVRGAEKINGTAEILELARDLGHKRGDMMEICVWEEGIGVHGDEVFYMQAVHQESDVVPESVDAIRAAMGFEDADKSIAMTNKSLGIE